MDDDPLQKLLLSDAEFARLTMEQKFAYIQKVLRALAIEQQPKPDGQKGPDPSPDDHQ